MPATRPTLGISRWPDFDYDATGATTLGKVTRVNDNNTISVDFDMTTFEGPPVNASSTKLFGIPLPFGISIDIVPISLSGNIDTVSGSCHLDFEAEFRGSLGGGFITLPSLSIVSPLTTGTTEGGFRKAEGTAFGQDISMPYDEAELVGIARVPRVSGGWDWMMNAMLMLPTDALAVLPCKIRVWDPDGVDEWDEDLDTINNRYEAFYL
eukprot:CAMPEP_0114253620 /NCGR_PEP_ID=MMETSP0058-20121206/16493_1 /TAXON_ID=36894 /ORGANISM="Pyramimonas parkeae, CCMP726" /LENGTH=208 /DNA_ID=CAMNT_0001367685 /DNA_START=146 /DNA_END=772 /DNA_ORIENTATION=-